MLVPTVVFVRCHTLAKLIDVGDLLVRHVELQVCQVRSAVCEYEAWADADSDLTMSLRKATVKK